MLDIRELRETAEKCRRRADTLLDDAETLRRFGDELAELAAQIEVTLMAMPHGPRQ